MVQEQERAGGVALEASGLAVRLEVQHDALVAEADAEVLKPPVAATGLRQRVVELVAVHGVGVTGRGPKRGFAAARAVVVVEHPPMRERVAELHGACGEGVLLKVVLFAADVLQLSGFLALVLRADKHLDLRGESQEAAVEVACDPLPAAFGDTVGRLDGVVALVPAEQHDLGAVVLSSQ